MNQWHGQREIYRACAQGALEEKIIEVTFTSPMLGFASDHPEALPGQKQLRKDLVQWIAQWRQLMATRSNLAVTAEQMGQEVDFLVKYFPKMTLGDLQWMQDQYVLRQLPVDYPDIVVFNADFLSRVIHGYQVFKRQRGARLAREVQKRRQLRRTGTPRQNAEGMRYMIAEVERQIREEAPMVFMLRDVYQYLRRTAQMGTGAENSEEAIAYAKRRFAALAHQAVNRRDAVSMKDLLQGAQLTGKEAAKLHEVLAIEWVVRHFFLTHPVQEVISKVKPEHWEK